MSAGVFMRVKRNDGVIIIPAQGNSVTSVFDMWADTPGAGTWTYTLQVYHQNSLSTGSGPYAHSLRRIITGIMHKK